MTGETSFKKNLGMLLLAALFMAFFFQGTRGLWEPDEGFYATVSGTMARTGDDVVPRVNGGIFLEKPPVVYWGMLAGLRLFGWNEWGLRAFHAVSFSLTVLLLALLGAALWDAATGIRAGIFYLLMALPFGAANILTPDMPLTLFVTAGLFCFWKGWREGKNLWKVGFLFSFAAAWMTKSTASIVWASAPVMFLILSGGVKKYLRGWWLWTLVPIAVASLAWYFEVGQRTPGALAYFWKDQVTGRMVSNYYRRNPGWKFAWYYVPVLIGGALPLSLFWPKWGRELWRRYRTEGLRIQSNPERLFVLCWIVFPMCVLTLAQSRL
jgi:4-amino-4-deoxy-L-arabinose transferase-like glycosyltransferase